MEKTEIKKALYKQNPTATLLFIQNGVAFYETSLDDGTVIYFDVPVSDMGEAKFMAEVEAKFLIRWIKE